jgi:two-component system, OmpR family, sensor histidine kinase CreC
LKLSLKLFLVYFLLVGIGLFTFFSNATQQLHPIIRQSAENAMLDTANLLAEILASKTHDDQLAPQFFNQVFEHYQLRNMNASIWEMKKQYPDLGLYITDIKGKVLFHSDQQEIGKDYSRWLDVSRTLKGEYGARTTRVEANNDLTSVMYVAAPILKHNQLIGVLTVFQPTSSSQPFIEFAHQQLFTQGSLILLIALGVGAVLTYWLTRSIRQLSSYVQKVRSGERPALPKIHERELAELAEATESMRQELDGKSYIENYVHTLTHEMKSPLAAIRGAAELLEEGDMDVSSQRKFLHNIVSSAHRMQDLIDRLLSLAALENLTELEKVQSVNLLTLVKIEVDAKRSYADRKNIRFKIEENSISDISGDEFLLKQAISNLLDNALHFADSNTEINLRLEQGVQSQVLFVFNKGPLIPDYALPRIFERFYSLAHPDTHQKSSGLGLSFVQEIAKLHEGSIHLSNIKEDGYTGVEAEFRVGR